MHPRFYVLRITHVRRPSACRTLPHAPPFPTHLFHVKQARTIPARNRERGFDTRPGRRFAALTAFVLAALVLRPGAHGAERSAGCVAPRRRAGFSTHMFHVKHASIVPARPMGIVVLAQ